MPNPLAISVTLGGLLLDILVPRPKPRAGYVQEPSLLSARAVPRTPPDAVGVDEYDGALTVGAGESAGADSLARIR